MSDSDQKGDGEGKVLTASSLDSPDVYTFTEENTIDKKILDDIVPSPLPPLPSSPPPLLNCNPPADTPFNTTHDKNINNIDQTKYTDTYNTDKSSPITHTNNSVDGIPAIPDVQQSTAYEGEPYIYSLPDCVLVNIIPYFNTVECCILMLVSKRWNNLFSSQHIWKLWCEQESWFGQMSFFSRRRNSSMSSYYTGPPPQNKQQRLDYKERWRRLKQSEKRWKQGVPFSSATIKNAHETLVVNMGCHNSDYLVYSADRCGRIKTWDTDTGACISMIDCGESVNFAEFSDDEVVIVATTEGMHIWDLKSSSRAATLSSLQYNSVVLDGSNLLAVSSNLIELWDIARPDRIFEFQIEKSILCASLHGNIFATGAHKSICMWDIRTHKCERVIKAGAFDIELNTNCIVSCHAFEFAQKRNLSKYWYNLLTVRDLRSEFKQEKVVDGGYILYALEGRKLVAGNDAQKVVDVWDVGLSAGFKHQKPGRIEIEGGAAACITSRVSRLCVAARTGDIYVYDF